MLIMVGRQQVSQLLNVVLAVTQSFQSKCRHKQKQICCPPTNPITVLSRFRDEPTAALALTLPHIFNILAPGSRQNTEKQDHSTMIKGKTQNEK